MPHAPVPPANISWCLGWAIGWAIGIWWSWQEMGDNKNIIILWIYDNAFENIHLYAKFTVDILVTCWKIYIMHHIPMYWCQITASVSMPLRNGIFMSMTNHFFWYDIYWTAHRALSSYIDGSAQDFGNYMASARGYRSLVLSHHLIYYTVWVKFTYVQYIICCNTYYLPAYITTVFPVVCSAHPLGCHEC